MGVRYSGHTVVSERRSENGAIVSQRLARLNQALAQQKIKIGADIHWRHLQLLSLALRRRDHCCRIQAEEVADELVRMLSLDTERPSAAQGKSF